MEEVILIVGGPSGGFEYFGPFPDSDSAIEFAELNEFNENWWVVPLLNPANPN